MRRREQYVRRAGTRSHRGMFTAAVMLLAMAVPLLRDPLIPVTHCNGGWTRDFQIDQPKVNQRRRRKISRRRRGSR